MRMVAVALVLAAVGALGQPHLLPGPSQAGVAQAQSPEDSTREAPEITALIHPTTSSIAVVWLPADDTDVHWIYVVKTDGSGGRFQLAVPDPPPSQDASAQSDPVTETSHVTTVTGLAAGTQYWIAVLGVRAPSESSPSTWFRWSNWGRTSTLTTPTVSLSSDVAVAEGGTATFTVTAAPAPQSALTVNYAIGADDDPATVNGDGSDYSGTATGSITIAADATQGSIAIVITDDSDIDDGARETLVVTISLPEGSSYQLGGNASATVTITEGVCDRTTAVRSAILDALTGKSACAEVTDPDLRGITGTLDLSGKSLAAVQARDFFGLTSLTTLRLNNNSLASLPADVFDGLTSLNKLYLNNNSLTALPEDLFDGLTNLQYLRSSNNSLASLPADVFDGLTSLMTLRLNNNDLASLPADVFDGLTGLTTLRLNNNDFAALPDDLFAGLTGLEGLFLDNNPGSPFTFTAEVKQTAATEVLVVVVQAAPFDMSVTLSVQGGTLSDRSVTVAAGSGESSAITVAPSGDAPVTVSATSASFPASGVATNGVTIKYNGIQTGVGAANQAPTANAGPDQSVDAGATVMLDASGSSDPDTGDTLSYAWEQSAGATVTLSSTTAAGPTFTAPSSAASLTFRVTVMDAKGGSDRDTVAITVSENQPPAFTSSATFSLAENTTAVGTVTATDPDADDSVTGYSLSGTDAALFAITSAGVLTFSSAPNFEDAQGGTDDDSNSYNLTVTATGGTGDRALTATQDLTVTATDVNEAPTFTSSATLSLAENTTAVGTVVATDPDIDDSVTGYTLSGTDAALFAITTAGALSFSAAPDFEDPQGGTDDDSNSYTLTVTATGGAGDRALTATQDLTVTVTDANEAPTFTSSATFSLAENTTAVGTIVATDPDAADSVAFALSGTDAALFAITTAGALSFSAAPDFEDPQGGTIDDSNSYTLTVTATGGTDDRALTATHDLTITVTNANEAPTFTSSATFSVAEDTTAVGTVIATDPDADDSISGYTLSGTDAALFAITSAGVLTFSTAPNFEDPQGGTDDDSNGYTLTVTATGGTSTRARTVTQDLTVTVTDGNDPPGAPVALEINSSFDFSWNPPIDDGGSPILSYFVEGHWKNANGVPIRSIRVFDVTQRSASLILHSSDPPDGWASVSAWVYADNAVGRGLKSASINRKR
ncbi:MAG: leucine-rich repeat protein [Chloroflexi bacterium]|nr:leucine-rich repeat protein [Chloroflexota bacterium]